MPLTPEDVSNKRFTPVRLREGYDMGEVDQFLDEVEAELARLTRENDDLRQKLQAAQQGGGAAPVPEKPVAKEPEPVKAPERLEAEAKVKSERMEADARTRSQMLDSETAERRQQLFGDLEKEKDKLNSEVETLRNFEREYRSRLKTYFTQQLEILDNSGETGGNPALATSDHAPKRLKSLLGDDADNG